MVDGAASVARFFNMPFWIIGMVIAGIGTSIPEFSIAFISVLRQESGIGLGTIIGSNIFNILFILGISSLVRPLTMQKDWVQKGLGLNLVAALVAFIVLRFSVFNEKFMGIVPKEGLLLFVFFLIWFFYVIFRKKPETEDRIIFKLYALPVAIFLSLVGIFGVILGGKWVVDGAAMMARLAGISESLIGLTVLAIGTSIPELAVSVTAAFKKNPGIAVGNIVGSNIFSFLGILGFSAIFYPITFELPLVFDMTIVLLSSIILFIVPHIGTSYKIDRWQGGIFVLLYIIYFAFILYRG